MHAGQSPEYLSSVHSLCFVTPRPWRADEFTTLLAAPGVFLLSHAHGFALGRIAGPEAELLTIAVHPNAQNAGHGRRLIDGFIAESAARGAEDVFLEVAENNANAIALYTRAGFIKIAERANYFKQISGPPLTAYIYKHTIYPKNPRLPDL